MLLKSRNTLVVSAVLFLLVVILLRLTSGFIEDNIVRVIGSIAGGAAESIPLIDFGTIDLSWINPMNWSFDGIATNVNEWLHTMIDSVLPAFIHTMNLGAILSFIARAQLIGAFTKAAPLVVAL